ncbi:putative membrane protein [Peptoniphilus sp. ING2-D1G]|nr:putative membrane protein [Peptoniphilus sp. ING2-D1G]
MDKTQGKFDTKYWLNVVAVISTILCLGFLYYGFKINLFTSEDELASFLLKFGILAPLVMIALQALQVVIPVVPLAMGLVVSVLLFGPLKGFIYNYIGISIGSIIAFLIAKKYGVGVLKLLFKEKTVAKYRKIGLTKEFVGFFTLAIFFPLAPDDFLCYLAGTTKMKLETFVPIILLGKPLSLACYTFGLSFLTNYMTSFIK